MSISTYVECRRSAGGVSHPCALDGIAMRVKGGCRDGAPSLGDECQACDGFAQTLQGSRTSLIFTSGGVTPTLRGTPEGE